jgi:hypothetical protein
MFLAFLTNEKGYQNAKSYETNLPIFPFGIWGQFLRALKN